MKEDRLNYVQTCITCQMVKPDLHHPSGLLQPLPVPATLWSSIDLDFITGQPHCDEKDIILVIVDLFTKSAHFISLTHPYSTKDVAQCFFQPVYILHGIPTSIVTDRDPIFTSSFWCELMQLFGGQSQYEYSIPSLNR
jgi:hypothetical protein